MQKEYTQTKEQVLEGLRTDRQGLSAQEAEKRLREHGENRLKEAEKLTLVSAVCAAAEGSHAADPAGGGSGVRRDQYPVP